MARFIYQFLLFFIIFYIEGTPSEGGFSVRQLWKIPLMVYLTYYCFVRFRVSMNKYCKINIALSVKQFINHDIYISFKSGLTDCMREIIFSLFYFFLRRKYQGKENKLELWLFKCAQFISLSSIPVLTGIVKPMVAFRDLTSFGVEDTFYSGIFGAYHVASFYFSMSAILLLFFYKKMNMTRWMKLFILFLIVVDIYSLFRCYVRTGWVLCLVGLLISFYPKRMNLSHFYKYLAYLCIIFSILVVFYNTNDAFRYRINGNNIYRNNDSSSIDTDGSGRSKFWKNGIELWADGDALEIFIGHGFVKVAENNSKKTGMRVFSHNNFVDQLARNGLIGFCLLLAFFYYLYKDIKRHKDSEYYRLALAFLAMLAVYNFFQSSFPFLFAFLFPSILICLEKDKPKNPVELPLPKKHGIKCENG